MTSDAFKGLGYALVFFALVIFFSGWGCQAGCSYLCKKYRVKIEEAKP